MSPFSAATLRRGPQILCLALLAGFLAPADAPALSPWLSARDDGPRAYRVRRILPASSLGRSVVPIEVYYQDLLATRSGWSEAVSRATGTIEAINRTRADEAPLLLYRSFREYFGLHVATALGYGATLSPEGKHLRERVRVFFLVNEKGQVGGYAMMGQVGDAPDGTHISVAPENHINQITTLRGHEAGSVILHGLAALYGALGHYEVSLNCRPELVRAYQSILSAMGRVESRPGDHPYPDRAPMTTFTLDTRFRPRLDRPLDAARARQTLEAWLSGADAPGESGYPERFLRERANRHALLRSIREWMPAVPDTVRSASGLYLWIAEELDALTAARTPKLTVSLRYYVAAAWLGSPAAQTALSPWLKENGFADFEAFAAALTENPSRFPQASALVVNPLALARWTEAMDRQRDTAA